MAICGKRTCHPGFIVLQKKGTMKALRKPKGEIDPTRVALFIGISIGLGIVVHEGFFAVAGAIAVGGLAVAALHAVQQHAQHAHPASHTK